MNNSNLKKTVKQGRTQKFSEGGILKNFKWKIFWGGGFSKIFLKNPSKMKKISERGGIFPPNPPLATRLPLN
jgi:hypothetical protein